MEGGGVVYKESRRETKEVLVRRCWHHARILRLNVFLMVLAMF